MPINITCTCGAVYNLKNEYSGARLSCPKCGAAIDAPSLPPAPPVRAQKGDSAFARDKFLLNQRHFAIKEKYSVADEAGADLMYVERPRYIFLNLLAIAGGIVAGVLNYGLFSFIGYSVKNFVPAPVLLPLVLWSTLGSIFTAAVAAMALSKKRHITVYRDDSKFEVLLRVWQDDKIQLLTACYTVTDPQGAPLAFITKKTLHNILRKRWYCRDGDAEPLFTAKEDSMILSLLRRFLGSFFGLLRTNFIIYDRSGNILGEFNRRMTILDRYVMDMSSDSLRTVDRRVALAMGVLLDTGEKR